MATKPADKKAPDTKASDNPGSTTGAQTLGVPDQGTGKGEKRLFQNGPGEKVWMTKAEAEKAGKFWNENEKV